MIILLRDKLLITDTDNRVPTDDLHQILNFTGGIVCQCASHLGKLACAGFVIDGNTVYLVIAQNEDEYNVLSRPMTGMNVIEQAVDDLKFTSCFIVERHKDGFHILTKSDFAEEGTENVPRKQQ